jgi:hypothetical protein
MSGTLQVMVNRYMDDLQTYMDHQTTYTWIDPLPLDTMKTMHTRIHHMWYNGLDHVAIDGQSVHCAATTEMLSIKIMADCGRVFISDSSADALTSIKTKLQKYKHSAVNWVYVPLAMHWDHPISNTSNPFILCMLVIDNVKMTFDFFEPMGKALIQLRDPYQHNAQLIVPLYTVLLCNQCNPGKREMSTQASLSQTIAFGLHCNG